MQALEQIVSVLLRELTADHVTTGQRSLPLRASFEAKLLLRLLHLNRNVLTGSDDNSDFIACTD